MPDRRVTAAQRRAVFARARGCCEYCQSQARFATQSFAAEHIIPRYAGGETTLDNLALACFGCNSHKYTKTHALDPITGSEVPLFHPRRHEWFEHFAWNDDFTQIVGQTPIGRATIEALRLNRSELVNLRRVLRSVGEHPPQT
ncbi:MAG: HNH endonuclease [Chloroflexi bacterium]|nr:HNH endonuclease [Chloroflexota bacterium]